MTLTSVCVQVGFIEEIKNKNQSPKHDNTGKNVTKNIRPGKERTNEVLSIMRIVNIYFLVIRAVQPPPGAM